MSLLFVSALRTTLNYLGCLVFSDLFLGIVVAAEVSLLSFVFFVFANTPIRKGLSTWSQGGPARVVSPALDWVRSREVRLRAGLAPLLVGLNSAPVSASSNNATGARALSRKIPLLKHLHNRRKNGTPKRTAIASWNLTSTRAATQFLWYPEFGYLFLSSGPPGRFFCFCALFFRLAGGTLTKERRCRCALPPPPFPPPSRGGRPRFFFSLSLSIYLSLSLCPLAFLGSGSRSVKTWALASLGLSCGRQVRKRELIS